MPVSPPQGKPSQDPKKKRPLRLLLAGSGTAGPVMPLIAVVQELRSRELPLEALFLGTEDGPERAIAKHANIPFKEFPAGKFRRYFSWRNVSDLFRIIWAFLRALVFVARFNPHVFVSAGGFIAPPIAWASWFLGVPVLIHQQDVEPLLANRLMVRPAKRITVTFEASLTSFPADKAVWTGNPVREDLVAGDPVAGRRQFGFGLSKPTIMVMGGGTGAEAINKALIPALPQLLPVCNVLHLTGEGKEPTAALEELGKRGESLMGYRSVPFLHEMSDAYALADIVVTRAGFSTLTELSFLEKSAVVIPLPDSPQVSNARIFADRGAVLVLSQSELNSERLSSIVLELLGNDARRREMARLMGKSMKSNATSHLADELLEIAKTAYVSSP